VISRLRPFLNRASSTKWRRADAASVGSTFATILRHSRWKSLIDELSAAGSSTSDIVRFLRYDYMLKEYTTTFATA
jgi:hypothetical protein